MLLKPGSRWKSAVSDVEVVVVRPPKDEGELTCGGAAMVPHAALPATAAASAAIEGETSAGKRYASDESGIELLCTKTGAGALAFGGASLLVKGAKPLPSSD